MQHNDLAKDLLEIGAVQVKTDHYFTWTSGIKSPIYCDNRLTMSYPIIRAKITNRFLAMIEEMDIQPDVIAGTATAGIPHAAWLSDKLRIPMVYVRSKPKAHGKGNQIEGAFQKGQHVLVIEDLISTGMSSIETANALRDEELNVLGVYAIFTYGLQKGLDQFKKAGLFHQTILTFDDILELLFKEKNISKEEFDTLLAWRNDLSQCNRQ